MKLKYFVLFLFLSVDVFCNESMLIYFAHLDPESINYTENKYNTKLNIDTRLLLPNWKYAEVKELRNSEGNYISVNKELFVNIFSTSIFSKVNEDNTVLLKSSTRGVNNETFIVFTPPEILQLNLKESVVVTNKKTGGDIFIQRTNNAGVIDNINKITGLTCKLWSEKPSNDHFYILLSDVEDKTYCFDFGEINYTGWKRWTIAPTVINYPLNILNPQGGIVKFVGYCIYRNNADNNYKIDYSAISFDTNFIMK